MTAKKSVHVKVAKPAAPSEAAAALEATQKEMGALEAADLATINVDIAQAVAIALGAKPSLDKQRDAIVAAFKAPHLAYLDHLQQYALAAWYAHVLAKSAAGKIAALSPDEDAEATKLRADLLGDADALANRGLLDAGSVAAIRAGSGQGIDRANDLVALAALFGAHWKDLHTKTAATDDEIARAGVLGTKLLVTLGATQHGPKPEPTAAADQRARAFTVFSNAYDECRRMVSYLRWHDGDADAIAPSIYQAHGRHAATTEPVTEPPAGQVPAPPIAQTNA